MKIKSCSFCLAVEVKLSKLGNTNAKHFIESILRENGFTQSVHKSQYICYECKALSYKLYHFMQRVIKTQCILDSLKKTNKMVTLTTFKQINRQKYGISSNLMTHVLKNIDILPDSKSQNKNDGEDNVTNIKLEFQEEINIPVDLTDSCKFDTIDEIIRNDNSVVNSNNMKTNLVNIEIPIKLEANNDENDQIKLTDTCDLTMIDDNDDPKDLKDNLMKIEIPKIIKAQNDEIDNTETYGFVLIDDIKQNDDPVLIDHNTKDSLLDNKKRKNLKAKIVENDPTYSITNQHHKIDKRRKQKGKKLNSKKRCRIYKPSNFILSLSNVGDKSERRKNKTNYVVEGNCHGERDADFKPESFSEESSSENEVDDNGKVIKRPRAYPRKCDDCDFEVPSGMEHYRHYTIVHPNIHYPYAKNTKYVCQYCGKTSTSLYYHRNHELSHSDEKSFHCCKCPKSFRNRIHLYKHDMTIHRKNLLECDYCSKKFKQKVDIERHLRIHTGEKPFKCHLCGAGFAHKGNVGIHIRGTHEQLDKEKRKNKKRRKPKRMPKRRYSSEDSLVNLLELS